MKRLSSFLIARDWARISIGAGLIAVWLLVLAGVPRVLPTQAASWLVFLALLIAPGYLLGDLITRRLGLDLLERLALALPLGVVVLAVPGLVSLLQHGSIQELATGWMITSGLVILVWLVHGVLTMRSRQQPIVGPRWAPDEILMLIVLIAGFVAILPTLNLTKIDGDAYAVASFSADALAGLPLNATEPIFGTDLGPGVRMLFNQTLPLAYLWSYFSGIDPITLASTASRAMPALWVLLAAYTLGRAAVKDSRRFGLFTAAVTLLIYVAAPFLRGDNVSLFFFERTNADKFLVPVTMLPVAFALAIRYVRDGQWPAWVAAALVVLAVSAIHPLVAAMLTVGLVGFAGFHLLLNLRQRTAWRRVLAVGGLVVAAMALPLLQLVIARGDAPLADSYPTSFEGWSVGKRSGARPALSRTIDLGLLRPAAQPGRDEREPGRQLRGEPLPDLALCSQYGPPPVDYLRSATLHLRPQPDLRAALSAGPSAPAAARPSGMAQPFRRRRAVRRRQHAGCAVYHVQPVGHTPGGLVGHAVDPVALRVGAAVCLDDCTGHSATG